VDEVTRIPLPFAEPPLTKNKVRRMHHHVEATIRRDAIAATRLAIVAANVKPLEQAVVILHWQQPDKRRRDGDGADPTKAFCLDALVLEGVLPDDSWAHVLHSGVTVHPPVKGQPGAMWLSISDPKDAA
jgi:crossover junction endodeoxyribonuclease RusA